MIKINCDLCGKVDERLNRTLIEGVELHVCPDCSKFGKVLAPIKRNVGKEPVREFPPKEEKIELLVEDYAKIIKKKRESMGLTQKEFANKLNEKESTIHKIETCTLEPSLALTKKLEKVLGVKLIEEYEERQGVVKKRREECFTLGDFIHVKNQK